ncbi:MAG: NUDIX domain-containing protein [Campylobacterales bacterium]|nr:NUDIX domain-containing protein [Campylobacterales bacterium]
MGRIEFGKLSPNKKNTAFLVIFVREMSPWRYFKDQSHIKCPAVIMIDRWDGRTGFPGGTLEEGETLEEALVREIKEEIGLNIKPQKLIPVVSREWKITSHLFALELIEMEFLYIYYHILNNFSRSILLHAHEEVDNSHFLSEITGIKIVPILNQEGKGISNFLQNGFAGYGKEDLETFIQEILQLEIENEN